MALLFTVQFSGTFQTPPYTGQPECPIPVNFTSQYTRKTIQRFEKTGVGTDAVDLSNLPAEGAKLVVVQVDPDSSLSALPIQVQTNGGTDDIEISQGGFLALGSPRPAVGITALTFSHASNVSLWVWAYG